MGGGSLAKEHPWEYLAASAMSALINYPLWRASAVGQSGFSVSSSHLRTTFLTRQAVAIIPVSVTPYLYAFAPPYKGMMATILGMTWARAAIFWGSDYGKHCQLYHGFFTVRDQLPQNAFSFVDGLASPPDQYRSANCQHARRTGVHYASKS
eukprot:scaffold685580_cov55-Attheya_sp.AAC.1